MRREQQEAVGRDLVDLRLIPAVDRGLQPLGL